MRKLLELISEKDLKPSEFVVLCCILEEYENSYSCRGVKVEEYEKSYSCREVKVGRSEKSDPCREVEVNCRKVAKLANVSLSTVRRALASLEGKGIVKRRVETKACGDAVMMQNNCQL